MKVIDLLNKIANGEETPKKFIYEGNLYYLQKEKCYRSDDINDIFESQFIFEDLNNEVEIIEEPQEHKIPEKLNISNFPRHNNSLKKTAIKINEILNYLEEIK